MDLRLCINAIAASFRSAPPNEGKDAAKHHRQGHRHCRSDGERRPELFAIFSVRVQVAGLFAQTGRHTRARVRVRLCVRVRGCDRVHASGKIACVRACVRACVDSVCVRVHMGQRARTPTLLSRARVRVRACIQGHRARTPKSTGRWLATRQI